MIAPRTDESWTTRRLSSLRGGSTPGEQQCDLKLIQKKNGFILQALEVTILGGLAWRRGTNNTETALKLSAPGYQLHNEALSICKLEPTRRIQTQQSGIKSLAP